MLYNQEKIGKSAIQEKVGNKTPRISPMGPYISPFLMDITTLQQTVGNREVQRMMEKGLIMAKLFLNTPGDIYEKEADKVAEMVVNQGYGVNKETTSPLSIQKKGDASGGSSLSSGTETKLKSLQGKGDPLEPGLRNYFQPRFGVDLGNVRVHRNTHANMLARAIRARAFTMGNNVVFAKGEYNPGTHEGKKLVAHELTHVLQQNNHMVHRQVAQDINQIITDAFARYNSGSITMPDMARLLLPFVITNADDILDIFNELPSHHRDNLAYAMAANSTDAELILFPDRLLQRMMQELGEYWSTTSHSENNQQKDRIKQLIHPTLSFTGMFAAVSLEFLRSAFNNNLTGSVGRAGDNSPVDVQLVARGLLDRNYSVPQVSLFRGICTPEFISIIERFQADVVGLETPDGVIDARGGSLRVLFNKQNNSYSSGLTEMYGQSANALNTLLEGRPLTTWARSETFNQQNQTYDYTIDTSSFIDRDTYHQYLRTIAGSEGVESGSVLERVLAIAGRAATDESFFNALTGNATFQLRLRNETSPGGGAHQVNSVLRERLRRYHKFLSAVGLFRGDMTGSACRDPAYAHKICVAHVVMCAAGIRPAASKQSIRNNLIDVYNGVAVAGGSKDASNNVKDSDNHIWARTEHFVLDDEGVATAMNDETWYAHLETFQPGRNWDTYTAEGYKRNDTRRFPLGLNAVPGRSNHITGDAIDINHGNFVNMDDAINDLIALYFGLMRPVPREHWHFECTNVVLSPTEARLINANPRESIE